MIFSLAFSLFYKILEYLSASAKYFGKFVGGTLAPFQM